MPHEPTMKSVFLLFPHQLFEATERLTSVDAVYLIEEQLFFKQYAFHKQKLLLHRASMKHYEQLLHARNIQVSYIEATQANSDIRVLLPQLAEQGITQICCYDPCDNWLEKRLRQTSAAYNVTITEYPTALFLNTKEDLKEYFESKTRYFQTDFYIQQRKKWNILIHESGKPLGGKWSFDAENRLKYPKDKIAPKVSFPSPCAIYRDACAYVSTYFPHNPGTIQDTVRYPYTHEQSQIWLQQFLEQRFSEFGIYEDAIVAQESFLHHGVLTPMLNIGLLLPGQVVQAALDYAALNDIPLNSLEGFIRQIIGWREFIRGVYVYKGTEERRRNYWNFHRPLPTFFYTGKSGMPPIDTSIRKLLDSGYTHHIERLMILGNFMLLCEIHPDEVYRWFMELYIDAYDWVMVPNVYGMSQFADGGLMATKPYISGSSYVLKMSNFPKGDWCAIWDALFWEFMQQHREFFSANPRLGMLLKTYDKMHPEKQALLKTTAEQFLRKALQ